MGILRPELAMMKKLPASLVLLLASASLGTFAQGPAASAARPSASAETAKKAEKKKVPAKAPRDVAAQATAEAPRGEEPRRSYGCE